MNRSETALVMLLRVSGIVLLTALIPAVMPFSWMNDIHQHLGMGTLPAVPITGYLTRSLSAMYALHGALVVFVSLDIRRYLPVVKCLAVLGGMFGFGMLALDLVVGVPWVFGEGPSVIVLSGVLLWLTRHVQPSSDAHS